MSEKLGVNLPSYMGLHNSLTGNSTKLGVDSLSNRGMNSLVSKSNRFNVPNWTTGIFPHGSAKLDLDFIGQQGYVQGYGLGGCMDHITFSRASSGTYFGSDGRLASATNNIPRFDYDPSTPVFGNGNELVLNGNFNNGLTGWVVGGGATLSTVSGQLQITNTGTNGWAVTQNNINATVGVQYFYSVQNVGTNTITLYIRDGVGSNSDMVAIVVAPSQTSSGYFTSNTTGLNVRVFCIGTSGAIALVDNISIQTGVSLTTGVELSTVSNITLTGTAGYVSSTTTNLTPGKTYRVSYQYVLTSGAIQYGGAGINTGSIQSGYISGTYTAYLLGVAYGVAQLYSNTGVGTVTGLSVQEVVFPAKGLLIEESRTNLLKQSSMSSSPWTGSQSTIIPNSTIALDGTMSATFIKEDATLNYRYNSAGQITGASPLTIYTASAYLKAGTRGFGWIELHANTSGTSDAPIAAVAINLNTGTYTVFSGSATIYFIGNGWYRVSATGTTLTGQNQLEVRVGLSNSQTIINYTGDGVSGLYCWGAQLEQGPQATSYISTTTATATRAVDTPTIPLGNWFNSSQGTMIIEWQNHGTGTSGESGLFSINDGTGTNRIDYRPASALFSSTGSSGWSLYNDTYPSTTSTHRLELSYSNHLQNMVLDGSVAVTSNAQTVPPSPTIMNLGYLDNSGSGNRLNGHIRTLTYFPLQINEAAQVQFTTLPPTTPSFSLSLLNQVMLDSRITFTRADATSCATYFGSDGVLRTMPSNLLPYSNDLTNAVWVRSGGATTPNAYTINIGTVNALVLNYMTAPAGVGASGTAAFLLSGSGTIHISIDRLGAGAYESSTLQVTLTSAPTLYAVSHTMVNAGQTGYEVFINNVSGDTATSVTFGGAALFPGTYTAAQILASGGIPLTTTTPNSNPRFEYDPITLQPLGLRVEQAATNLLLQSRDMTQAAWTKASTTATKNQIGIDGVSSSATLVIPTTAASTHEFNQGSAGLSASGASYAISVYVKASGCNYFSMSNGAQTFGVDANLSTGVATAIGGVNYSFVSVGGGWWRLSFVTLGTNFTDNNIYYFADLHGSNGRVGTAGDGVSGVIIDAAQLELGTVATTPIFTTTSTVTRAADIDSSTAAIPGSSGTVVIQAVTAVGFPPSGQCIYAIDDGTLNNYFMIYRDSFGDIVARWTVGGIQQAQLSYAIVGNNTALKVAVAWSAGSFSISVNGTTPITTSYGYIPTVTTRRIGLRADGSIPWNGEIQSVTEYNIRRHDNTLKLLTT